LANPKRKLSKSRGGMRRAHKALKAPFIGTCPRCSEKKLPHIVCPSCGYYRGRKVIEIKTKA
jgi:large subunit ribosomal protein L32